MGRDVIVRRPRAGPLSGRVQSIGSDSRDATRHSRRMSTAWPLKARSGITGITTENNSIYEVIRQVSEDKIASTRRSVNSEGRSRGQPQTCGSGAEQLFGTNCDADELGSLHHMGTASWKYRCQSIQRWGHKSSVPCPLQQNKLATR